MSRALSRRKFIVSTALGTGVFWIGPSRVLGQEKVSANEKLNIGMVGTSNRAAENLSQVASQNIVAICDVDDKFLDAAAQKHPQAKKYNDFRRMLEQKEIDAVVVATPDHTHAVATVAALKSGRHVYCEKPLTHTISECRAVVEMTRKTKLVTQIGTQIHAGTNYRRVVELIQKDVIGPINEVHVWVNATYGGKELPKE